MYCPSCGQLNADQARFCISCGGSLVSPLEQTLRDAAPAGSREAAAPAVPLYAGFWKRAAAFVIDSLITAAALFVVVAAIVLLGSAQDAGEQELEGFVNIVAVVGAWLYFALMESSARQATLGKQALGLVVTDLNGQRIGFSRATGRYFGKILCGLTLGIGYLMAAFTARKQGLHDMVASTLVLNAAAAGRDPGEGSGTARRGGLTLLAAAALWFPVVGQLAAVAIPAYQDTAARAGLAEAYGVARLVGERALDEQRRTGSLTRNPYALGIEVPPRVAVSIGESGVVTAKDDLTGASFALLPAFAGGRLTWTCRSVDGDPKHLPAACRGG